MLGVAGGRPGSVHPTRGRLGSGVGRAPWGAGFCGRVLAGPLHLWVDMGCCDRASAPPQVLAAGPASQAFPHLFSGLFPKSCSSVGSCPDLAEVGFWCAWDLSPLSGETSPQALLTAEGPLTPFSLGVPLCLTPAGSPQFQACCGLGSCLEGPRPLSVWGTEGIKPEVGGSVDSGRLPGPQAWTRSEGTGLRHTPCAPQTP